MGNLILLSVAMSAGVFGHLMTLRRRFVVILLLLATAMLLYAAIYTYVGKVDTWNGMALAIFSMIAVLPFAGGVAFGTITGWLHLRWRTRRHGA